MSILVIAEHDHETINPVTAAVISAATAIGGPITLLVAGHEAGAAAQQAAGYQGVEKILHAEHASFEHFIAEPMADLLVSLAKEGAYTHILAPATTFGKNVLPRAAALLDTQQISDITGVESADTFIRPIYGGQAIATVQSSDSLKLITVRGTAFDKAETGGSAPVETMDAGVEAGTTQFQSLEKSDSERPDLTTASIVISGGRGIGSGEDFALIEKLADKLGAAIGASRAAVDAGYVPNDYQVGQTGKVVAPELYIAIGISGAIQHLAGMKESKTIVAINKDPDAPIFQIADYGLVADLFEAVPELTEKL